MIHSYIQSLQLLTRRPIAEGTRRHKRGVHASDMTVLRRWRRMYVVLLSCILSCALLCALGYVSPIAHADELDQTVSENETMSTERAVMETGHADIGPKVVNGEWKILARDDSGATPVWRPVENVAFKVSDVALLDAPTDGDYTEFGAKSGDKWWVIPQTQNPDVVWLGWNTQDPAASSLMNRGATMSLQSDVHPAGGQSWVFVQDGTFGKPRVLFDGNKTGAQDTWLDVNTHVHANWVFTAAGVYLMPVKFCAQTTDTADGQEKCAQSTLRFAVGNSTSTDDAFAAQPKNSMTADMKTGDTKTSDTKTGNRTAEKSEGKNSADTHGSASQVSGMTLLVIGLIVVAGVGAVIFLIRRSRIMSREIEQARAEVSHEEDVHE